MSLFRTSSSITLQQDFLERSLKSELSGSKHLSSFSLIAEHLSLQKKLDENRNEEARNFLKTLCAVMIAIKKLKDNITSEENIYKNDMSYFESTFGTIEENLSVLDHQIKERQICLFQEEEELQCLISTLIQRLNAAPGPEVKTNPVLSVHVRPQVSTASAYDSTHPDVQEFQDFLQKTGGHTGGWSCEDHLLFTKHLHKRRGASDFVITLLDQMPGKSEEDVNEHEAWYTRYLSLKEAHHRALEDWKKNRADLKALKKNNKEEPSSLPQISRFSADPDRSQELRAKVAEWKKKQDEKRKEEEEKILQQKKKEEEKWKQKMAYFERQRAILLERGRAKKAANVEKAGESDLVGKQMKELEEVEKRFDHAYLTLKDFREQDFEFMKRRKSRLDQQRQKREGVRIRSTSFSSSAKRDPSRLLQPTAIWKIRLHRSRSECDEKPRSKSSVKRSVCSINNIPHLAIPDWRKGVTLH